MGLESHIGVPGLTRSNHGDEHRMDCDLLDPSIVHPPGTG